MKFFFIAGGVSLVIGSLSLAAIALRGTGPISSYSHLKNTTLSNGIHVTAHSPPTSAQE